MKIAIVVSTYNGEKYITDQLESIRLQTIQPDEVLICDDCSKDSTPEIIKSYINRYKLDNWKFYVNKQNQGWKKNFINLITECSSDLIFLADQDDVWNKRKIELMVSAFEEKKVNILVCDWNKKSGFLDLNYKAKGNGAICKIDFSHKFMWVSYPGCAYCIRKSYFNSIKKWWRDWLPHDSFLFRNAMLDGSLYKIKSGLILHRMHGNNAGTPKSITQQKDDLQYYKNVLDLLLERAESEKILTDRQFNILKKSKRWLAIREEYYKTKSFVSFIKLFCFIKYYPHFKTYVKEFFVAFL